MVTNSLLSNTHNAYISSPLAAGLSGDLNTKNCKSGKLYSKIE